MLVLMMLKMMSLIDNDDGDADVDNWAASSDINRDDDFDVDEGYVVVNVVSGEYFDAHDVDDSDDKYGD